jgi:hypothetical protein
MPRQDRSWEQGHQPDGEVSDSAAAAIGFAFILVEFLALVVIGFTLTGLLVGAAVGIVVIIVLSKLIVRSQRPGRRSPPPDLL